jgi:peptidoglycan/xylan/chitin deacetylase (PgdA/CDA1 family)
VTWSLETSASLIESLIGHPIEPLYTPYASTIDANVRAAAVSIGYLPVGWKVAAVDFNWTATGDSVYNDIMPEIYDGAIVEMHLDGPVSETSTAVALPRFIADLTAQGYTFVTVQDMMQPCPIT